jgi:hypothetical protein
MGVVLIGAVVGSAGCSSQKPAPQGGAPFTNPDGKYTFVCPTPWNAVINQDNAKDSLFGPDATGGAGLGGVEVFPDQKSIDSFLGGSSAQVTSKTNVTVDGVSGVRTQYKGAAGGGTSVVLLKEDTIYNIYVNSEKSGDIDLFNQIVATFKFVQ